MASVAPAGPPPGLGPPQGSQAAPTSNSTRGQRYSASFLLKLAHSPLVETPSLPAFHDWFGEWETYTPRPHNHQHNQHGHDRYHNHRSEYTPRNQSGRYAHVSEDASGPMGEFSFSKTGDAGSSSAPPSAGGGYLTGFQGVRRREGERQEGARGYRKYEDRGMGDDRGDFATPRSANPRFPTSGKNPFGQLSASGTFRPAGKEGELTPDGKRTFQRVPSYGRPDREPLQLDEHGKPIRSPRGNGKDNGNHRDREHPRRRQGDGQDEDSEGGGEWETVPKSPETERRLARAGGLADSASDWRKGPGVGGLPKRGQELAGGKASTRTGRNDPESRRGAAGSSAFPSWMADSNETPSWMDDAPGSAPLSGASDRRERGKLKFDAFKGSEVHVTPMEGEDSIQAFKREMKRREAEARAKELGEDVGTGDASGASSGTQHGPPPGLSRAQETSANEDTHSAPAKQTPSRPPGLPSSAADESSSLSRGDEVSRRQDGESASQTTGSAEPSRQASDASQTGSGGRGSSRFARFFDGAAATSRAREAQEKALAAHAAATAPEHALPAESTRPQEGGQNAMAALFNNMALAQAGASNDQTRQASSASSRGDGARQPSEADLQGMQKIMAMLRGGGGAASDGQNGIASPSGGQNSGADLMAMLAGGGSKPGVSPSANAPSPHMQSRPSAQRHSMQQVPPGLDPSRLSSTAPHGYPGGSPAQGPARAQSPQAGFRSVSTPEDQPNRSQSPGVPFRGERPGSAMSHQQPNAGYGQGLPPPGFASSGRPGSAVGADARMLSRPPPGLGNEDNGPNGLASSPGIPPGANAARPGSGGNAINFAALPPQMQQQLMGLPPHVQHAVLNGQARGGGGGGGGGMGPMPHFPPGVYPPPPGMGGLGPQGPPHHLGPFGPPPPGHGGLPFGGPPPFLAGHQGPYGGGGGGGGANGSASSPGGLPPHLGPYGAPSPNHPHGHAPHYLNVSPNPSAASPAPGSGFPAGMNYGGHGHGHAPPPPPPGVFGGQGR